jgi:hypothetical protein
MGRPWFPTVVSLAWIYSALSQPVCLNIWKRSLNKMNGRPISLMRSGCSTDQVLTWLANRGVTVALSRANQPTSDLLAHYHLLELIGENRLYPTNRHAIAAFRQETGQARPETIAE